MNSKIIFWMNDALSFVGVPKTLQEKYGFEIFGIFDVTDKSKKFLVKQKLINFSKIWFFHDHVYKTNKKPDNEYLKSIYKNGHSLFRIAWQMEALKLLRLPV